MNFAILNQKYHIAKTSIDPIFNRWFLGTTFVLNIVRPTLSSWFHREKYIVEIVVNLNVPVSNAEGSDMTHYSVQRFTLL